MKRTLAGEMLAELAQFYEMSEDEFVYLVETAVEAHKLVNTRERYEVNKELILKRLRSGERVRDVAISIGGSYPALSGALKRWGYNRKGEKRECEVIKLDTKYEDRKENIIEQLSHNVDLKTIYESLGGTYGGLRLALRRWGYDVDSELLSHTFRGSYQDNKEKILLKLSQGISVKEIAQELGGNSNGLANAIRDWGYDTKGNKR